MFLMQILNKQQMTFGCLESIIKSDNTFLHIKSFILRSHHLKVEKDISTAEADMIAELGDTAAIEMDPPPSAALITEPPSSPPAPLVAAAASPPGIVGRFFV